MQLVALVAVLCAAICGCAEAGKPSASGSARVGPCAAGEPVGPVQAGRLPVCTTLEPMDSSYAYTCRHPISSTGSADFFVVYLRNVTLYGKPGGDWHEGLSSVPFAAIQHALDC
jgi:hypothetical protein